MNEEMRPLDPRWWKALASIAAAQLGNCYRREADARRASVALPGNAHGRRGRHGTQHC
jgi:hypothetical protein